MSESKNIFQFETEVDIFMGEPLPDVVRGKIVATGTRGGRAFIKIESPAPNLRGRDGMRYSPKQATVIRIVPMDMVYLIQSPIEPHKIIVEADDEVEGDIEE